MLWPIIWPTSILLQSSVHCITFSPDGRFLASGSADQRVLVWDIAYGHLLAQLDHHKTLITGISFSREGAVLASSDTSNSIILCCVFYFLYGRRLPTLDLTVCDIDHSQWQPNVSLLPNNEDACSFFLTADTCHLTSLSPETYVQYLSA